MARTCFARQVVHRLTDKGGRLELPIPGWHPLQVLIDRELGRSVPEVARVMRPRNHSGTGKGNLILLPDRYRNLKELFALDLFDPIGGDPLRISHSDSRLKLLDMLGKRDELIVLRGGVEPGVPLGFAVLLGEDDRLVTCPVRGVRWVFWNDDGVPRKFQEGVARRAMIAHQ